MHVKLCTLAALLSAASLVCALPHEHTHLSRRGIPQALPGSSTSTVNDVVKGNVDRVESATHVITRRKEIEVEVSDQDGGELVEVEVEAEKGKVEFEVEVLGLVELEIELGRQSGKST